MFDVKVSKAFFCVLTAHKTVGFEALTQKDADSDVPL